MLKLRIPNYSLGSSAHTYYTAQYYSLHEYCICITYFCYNQLIMTLCFLRLNLSYSLIETSQLYSYKNVPTLIPLSVQVATTVTMATSFILHSMTRPLTDMYCRTNSHVPHNGCLCSGKTLIKQSSYYSSH